MTATYAAGFLSIAVDVLGGAVTSEVSSTGPDAAAASGAREVAAFAARVVSVLGAAPPKGSRTAVARLWTTTATAARLEADALEPPGGGVRGEAKAVPRGAREARAGGRRGLARREPGGLTDRGDCGFPAVPRAELAATARGRGR